jgi:hypothetical protein
VGHDHSNVYANPSFATNVQAIPPRFANLLAQQGVPGSSVPTLTFTSLSLPYGGMFDVARTSSGPITNPWHPPHCEHRLGLAADLFITNINQSQLNVDPSVRGVLRHAIVLSQMRFPVRAESPDGTASHWHLVP